MTEEGILELFRVHTLRPSPQRFELLRTLAAAEGLTFDALRARMGTLVPMERSALRRQLAALVAKQIVVTEGEGAKSVYRLNHELLPTEENED